MLVENKASTLGLLAVVLTMATGCQEELSACKKGILFGEDGHEYDAPTITLCTRLEQSSEEDRVQLLNEMLDILESPRSAYSKVVAAKALLLFVEDQANRRYLTERVCRVIAERVVEIVPPLPDIWLHEDYVLKYPDELCVRIRSRCVLRVDGEVFIISGLLPDGWRGKQGKVELDGVLIERSTWGEEGDSAPLMLVDLPKALRKGGRLRGEHTLASSLVVVAPNGMETLVRREQKIHVVRRKNASEK